MRLSIAGIGDLTKIGVCYGESIFDAKFMNIYARNLGDLQMFGMLRFGQSYRSVGVYKVRWDQV